MPCLKAALFLGAFLSAGMLMAQQADPSPTPVAGESQAAPAQQAPDQSAPAQPMPPRYRHAPNPNRQVRHMARTLGLSREQVAQIRPILAARDRQMQSLADSPLGPRERRAQMRQITQDSRAKIEAVLNDSQRQQYEQMLAQRRARRNGAAQAPQG